MAYKSPAKTLCHVDEQTVRIWAVGDTYPKKNKLKGAGLRFDGRTWGRQFDLPPEGPERDEVIRQAKQIATLLIRDGLPQTYNCDGVSLRDLLDNPPKATPTDKWTDEEKKIDEKIEGYLELRQAMEERADARAEERERMEDEHLSFLGNTSKAESKVEELQNRFPRAWAYISIKGSASAVTDSIERLDAEKKALQILLDGGAIDDAHKAASTWGTAQQQFDAVCAI